MTPDLITASTYTNDRPLFDKLGLMPFEAVPAHAEHEVGSVHLDDGSIIMLWVEPQPAQFWKAAIWCAETSRFHLVRTGSGSLVEYWPMFKAIAEGTLVVEHAG